MFDAGEIDMKRIRASMDAITLQASRIPLKTRFEEEVEQYWGNNWGATTEVGKLRMVLLHKPGDEIKTVKPPLEKWKYPVMPDLEKMQEEHDGLAEALTKEGVKVVYRTPGDPRLVMSLYTRDPSMPARGGMIIGRMFDALRRGEEKPTAKTYADLGVPILRTIHGTGFLEGGGFMWLDEKHVMIGLSKRINEEGVRQAGDVLKVGGVEEVLAVPILELSGHLDGCFAMIDVHKAAVFREAFPLYPPKYSILRYLEESLKFTLIDFSDEMFSGGSLVIESGKIMIKSGCEESRKLLEKEGLDVIEVELTELTDPNNIGSLHCLTCPVVRDPEPSA